MGLTDDLYTHPEQIKCLHYMYMYTCTYDSANRYLQPGISLLSTVFSYHCLEVAAELSLIILFVPA